MMQTCVFARLCPDKFNEKMVFGKIPPPFLHLNCSKNDYQLRCLVFTALFATVLLTVLATLYACFAHCITSSWFSAVITSLFFILEGLAFYRPDAFIVNVKGFRIGSKTVLQCFCLFLTANHYRLWKHLFEICKIYCIEP